MQKIALLLSLLFVLQSTIVSAQEADTDSTLDNLQQLPKKYISSIDKKITQYSSRITSKTTKTLTKLSRWENKIKGMMEKVSPETAAQLFAPGQTTFTSLLQQVQQGEALALNYQAQYNKYTDDVTTSLKYIAQQKEQLDSGILKKAAATHKKMKELASEEDKSEALQQFIKERKKQLVSQAIQHIGQSKYLVKMNKEAFYYAETLKNYREIFSDSKKAEETVKGILSRIPAFSEFVKRNSMLSSSFLMPGDVANASDIAGLQTRTGITELIQQRIAAGGPNAMQQVQQNIQMGQTELNKLKDNLLKSPSFGNGGESLPDFKVNPEKSKTFRQRLQYNMKLQFLRSNTLMPTTSDIAIGAGYHISDKIIAGLQLGYKLGMGSIERVRFSNQGISLRSFADFKWKKNLFFSGGMELNYLSDLQTGITTVKYSNGWQQSALAGLSKKFSIKTKWAKETQLSVLYDFLAQQYFPKKSPLLFRVGYNF